MVFSYGRKSDLHHLNFHFILSILIVSFALANIMFLSSISNNVYAVPSTTGAGISSKDKCFEGGDHEINRIRPNYALVNPSNPFREVTGTVVESHVSHKDLPFNHWSHDSNFHVQLDPAFQNLNSLGNDPD